MPNKNFPGIKWKIESLVIGSRPSQAIPVFAGLSWLLGVWDHPKEECRRGQAFFGPDVHGSKFMRDPHFKMALCCILAS